VEAIKWGYLEDLCEAAWRHQQHRLRLGAQRAGSGGEERGRARVVVRVHVRDPHHLEVEEELRPRTRAASRATLPTCAAATVSTVLCVCVRVCEIHTTLRWRKSCAPAPAPRQERRYPRARQLLFHGVVCVCVSV
jgi:hypothetical protein